MRFVPEQGMCNLLQGAIGCAVRCKALVAIRRLNEPDYCHLSGPHKGNTGSADESNVLYRGKAIGTAAVLIAIVDNMIGFVFRILSGRLQRLLMSTLAVAATSGVIGARAQVPPAGGQVAVPGSSIAKPGDTGVRAHTNTLIFVPNRATNPAHSAAGGSSASQPSHPGTEPGGPTSPR